ncbi:tRNA splicing endonuclease subunit sen2 [Diplodia seriata]|uniref:tRNA-splicing endonuclease subunit Sen2 n=1 Tax=Diplodia seriata TaxID=420778 RepID=A0A1S8BDK6_9PEZI|nr:putative tRNA-splicing endonuclease subunit sen2 [Diplodia seriata]
MADSSGSSVPLQPAAEREDGNVESAANGMGAPHKEPKVNSKPASQRPRKPNYAKLHAQPLPVVTYPLPAFVPHNPLSLLRIAYLICSQYFKPPASHPSKRHVAYLSYETRSVHVTDPASVRALWEQGFFGKGSLSRSEPTWLDREKHRRGVESGQIKAEDYTNKRRQERREMKNERARKEREALEEQLRKEGKLADEATLESTVSENSATATLASGASVLDNGPDNLQSAEKSEKSANVSKELALDEPIQNEEHLQLSLEEAFFLTYGLGVLEVVAARTKKTVEPLQLFQLCRSLSYFPPSSALQVRPDDPFLLKYVVYHHFRSRGWVVRDGVKFSVDYMIYNRGPVFSHAEFAVHIVPSYSDPYWKDQEKKESNPWWWLHCVNRVQSQVLKTLVLVYVEVPPPIEGPVKDIGEYLGRYKVREFVLRRWVANRMRG